MSPCQHVSSDFASNFSFCLPDHFMGVKLGKNDDIEIFKLPVDCLFAYFIDWISDTYVFSFLPKLVSFSIDVDR